MKKTFFKILLIFLIIPAFSQEINTELIKNLTGVWARTPNPQTNHTSEFSWGNAISIPNSTYDIDLFQGTKKIRLPGFGTFDVVTINHHEENLYEIVFFFNRGGFNASLFIRIIDENIIHLVKYEKLDIHFSNEIKYYRVDGPYSTINSKSESILNQDNIITGTLNQSRVRIRKEPNLNGEQVGSLNKDQLVYILDRTTELMKIGEMNSVWYKIRTAEGIEGWSYGYFIDLNNEIAEVKYDTDDISIIRRIDDDMVSNVNVVYRSESDVILNIDEIEPKPIVTNILDKPVRNKNIRILSEYNSNSRYRNITKLLEQFEITLFPSDIEKINNLEGYYSDFIIQTGYSGENCHPLRFKVATPETSYNI